MDENNGGGAVEGFTLSGEEVDNLVDKSFRINAVPYYREMKSLDNPSMMKKKLVVPVELASGIAAEWIANKTSQKIIIARQGRILSNWVGFKGEFIVKNQVVGVDEKKVIYIKK